MEIDQRMAAIEDLLPGIPGGTLLFIKAQLIGARRSGLEAAAGRAEEMWKEAMSLGTISTADEAAEAIRSLIPKDTTP